jgi:glycosyltransferase involved in cell wall biosynthesis
MNYDEEQLSNIHIQPELLYHGFETTVLGKVGVESRTIDISFIGSIILRRDYHIKRGKVIQKLLDNTNIELWTPSLREGSSSFKQIYNLLKNPFTKLRMTKEMYPSRIHNPVYGLDMYRILAKSKITVNCDADGAGEYAGNMRMFEATGMGTLLITDWKKNITDLFEPDKEIITYKTPEECVEKVRYYQENEKEREKISLAGQQRTLKDHTFEKRMKQLVEIIERRNKNGNRI